MDKNKLHLNEVGNRIRTERIKNNLTIEQLSELINVSPSYMGLVERGARGLSLENLIKLADIFRTSTDYILLGEHVEINLSKFPEIETLLYNVNKDGIDYIKEFIKLYKSKIMEGRL